MIDKVIKEAFKMVSATIQGAGHVVSSSIYAGVEVGRAIDHALPEMKNSDESNNEDDEEKGYSSY